MIIAIDGPAASGKGTLARRLAAHFGLPRLDTGLLYRAVAARMLADGADLADSRQAAAVAAALEPGSLDEAVLRSDAVGEGASRVAAIPAVRAALVDLQRRFAARPGGAVLDGRDIGTVICPEADVKIFVTATPEVRAARRHAEALQRGEAVTFEGVLDGILARDRRDSQRSEAPLRPAADAILLDTSEMDIEAAYRAALAIADRKRRN
jgi:cytidylate kinase